MRTHYQVEITSDPSMGDICIALSDGYRGGDTGEIWGIYEARLLAHDIIEHLDGPGEIGTGHDEVLALGAVYYVRPHVAVQGLKYDIANVLGEDYQSILEVPVPAVYLTCESELEELHGIVCEGVQLWVDELDEPAGIDLQTVRTKLLALLSYGYVRASTHYAQVRVDRMFDSITEAAKVLLLHWTEDDYIGCLFDLTLDWNDGSVLLSPEPTNWQIEEDDYAY